MIRKFSTANIKRNANSKNLAEIGKMALSVIVAEMIPSVVQSIGGYKADGQPRISASGPVWDISTGLLATAVAYGFDKPAYGNAILMTKGVKAAYLYLNPQYAKITKTPMFLPAAANAVVTQTAITDGGMADSVPVTMPDGSIRQIDVATINDYGVDTAVSMLDGSYSESPFLTQLSDVYTNDPLSDVFTNDALSDTYTNDALSDVYTNDALSDIYSDNPLSDDFDFFDAVSEGEFD